MTKNKNAAGAQSGNNTQAENSAPKGRPVEESRAVSINVAGGTISGVFVRYATRTGRDGEAYNGWIIKDASGIVAQRSRDSVEVKPVPAILGRYFLFSATRLDRKLREVESGEKIRIDYLGKQPNEGGEGSHHAYEVVYID